MILGHFRLDVIEVNAFIFGCPQTRDAVLVDVGEFDSRLPDFVDAHQLKLTTIFLTHDHYDHVQGVADARTRFNATVISGTEAPGGHAADAVVAHGDTVSVGAMTGRVVNTSGHTPVGLSLIFDDQKTVFSGDALFAGSVGGTSNRQDYDRQLANIRENLFSLPDDTSKCTPATAPRRPSASNAGSIPFSSRPLHPSPNPRSVRAADPFSAPFQARRPPRRRTRTSAAASRDRGTTH